MSALQVKRRNTVVWPFWVMYVGGVALMIGLSLYLVAVAAGLA